ANGVGWIRDPYRAPMQADLARVGRSDSEDGLGKFRPAGADETSQTEDFAAADFKRNTANASGARRKILQRERNMSDGHRAFGINGFDLAANHHPDQVRTGKSYRVAGRDSFTVPKDCDPIGDGCHFFEAVRDINDAGPLGAQGADDLKEALDFA